MGKSNRVSVRKIDAAIDAAATEDMTIVWNGVEIAVKHTLSFEDMLRFVANVIDGCLTSETDTYVPEAKAFMIRACTLAYYTNVSLPKNLNKKYAFAYETDLFERVVENINAAQFNDICDAIEKKIDMLTNSAAEAANRQLVSLQNALHNLGEQVGTLFEGVDKDDMAALFGAVANGDIDEEKLMKALISAKQDEE